MLGADDENVVMPTADSSYTTYNRVSKSVWFRTFYSEVQSDQSDTLGTGKENITSDYSVSGSSIPNCYNMLGTLQNKQCPTIGASFT